MKSTNQRQAEYQKRQHDKGLREVRGIWLEPDKHKIVKELIKQYTL